MKPSRLPTIKSAEKPETVAERVSRLTKQSQARAMAATAVPQPDDSEEQKSRMAYTRNAYMPCGAAFSPDGWNCTRMKGHDGPCAAEQTEDWATRAAPAVEAAAREFLKERGIPSDNTINLPPLPDPDDGAVLAIRTPFPTDCLGTLLDLAAMIYGDSITMETKGEWLVLKREGGGE